MSLTPSQISLQVSDKVFLKNPESSALGKKIIAESISLIDEIGFEHFTFRKLGEQIGSPEASVYRYFENKHRLLIYLIDWYWNWMDVQIVFLTANIPDPEERLRRALHLLTSNVENDLTSEHVDEVKLNRIVISESSKTYLTKQVDAENREGLFGPFKHLVGRVADMITEMNPDYKYPHMLISTVIEAAHHQRFFAAHLPRLTDHVSGEDCITKFCQDLVFRTIKPTVC